MGASYYYYVSAEGMLHTADSLFFLAMTAIGTASFWLLRWLARRDRSLDGKGN